MIRRKWENAYDSGFSWNLEDEETFPQEMTLIGDFTVQRWRGLVVRAGIQLRAIGQKPHSPRPEGTWAKATFHILRSSSFELMMGTAEVPWLETSNSSNSLCSFTYWCLQYKFINEEWPWALESDRPEVKHSSSSSLAVWPWLWENDLIREIMVIVAPITKWWCDEEIRQ